MRSSPATLNLSHVRVNSPIKPNALVEGLSHGCSATGSKTHPIFVPCERLFSVSCGVYELWLPHHLVTVHVLVRTNCSEAARKGRELSQFPNRMIRTILTRKDGTKNVYRREPCYNMNAKWAHESTKTIKENRT